MFPKKNASACMNVYEPVTFAVIPDRVSQELWYSLAERCPGMDEERISRTVAHMVHLDLVFSLSLNTAFPHSISKGRGMAVYATAVHAKPHHGYFEGEFNAGQLRIQSSAVSLPPVWSLS